MEKDLAVHVMRWIPCWKRCSYLLTWLVLAHTQMGGIQDHVSHTAANAVVDTRSENVILAAGLELERTRVGRSAHDGQPIEHRHLAMLRNDSLRTGIHTDRYNDIVPGAILHVL